MLMEGGVASPRLPPPPLIGFGLRAFSNNDKVSLEEPETVSPDELLRSRSEEIMNGTLLTNCGSSSITPLGRAMEAELFCGCEADCSFLQELKRRTATISNSAVVKVFRDFILFLDLKV
jgi:hypothetical protein